MGKDGVEPAMLDRCQRGCPLWSALNLRAIVFFCSYQCFFCPVIQLFFFHHYLNATRECEYRQLVLFCNYLFIIYYFSFLNFLNFWKNFDTHDFYPHPKPTTHDPRRLIILNSDCSACCDGLQLKLSIKVC